MLYNEYLAEISRGQSQAKVLGKEGLSNKQVAAAYRGALEAAYNAEATNRELALRKSLGEGNLALQQDRMEAEKQAEKTKTMTQLGTLALTNSDKLVKGFNWLTGATAAPKTIPAVTAGTPAYTGAVAGEVAAGEAGAAAAGEAGAGAAVAGEVGAGAGEVAVAAGSGATAGEVGIAGAGTAEAGAGAAAGSTAYLGPAGVGFAAGSILGPMVGKVLPFGGSKEKGAVGGAIAGGILGGMAAGAMAGTAVFPVVGTIIGAVCGAIGGLVSGGK